MQQVSQLQVEETTEYSTTYNKTPQSKSRIRRFGSWVGEMITSFVYGVGKLFIDIVKLPFQIVAWPFKKMAEAFSSSAKSEVNTDSTNTQASVEIHIQKADVEQKSSSGIISRFLSAMGSSIRAVGRGLYAIFYVPGWFRPKNVSMGMNASTTNTQTTLPSIDTNPIDITLEIEPPPAATIAYIQDDAGKQNHSDILIEQIVDTNEDTQEKTQQRDVSDNQLDLDQTSSIKSVLMEPAKISVDEEVKPVLLANNTDSNPDPKSVPIESEVSVDEEEEQQVTKHHTSASDNEHDKKNSKSMLTKFKNTITAPFKPKDIDTTIIASKSSQLKAKTFLKKAF